MNPIEERIAKALAEVIHDGEELTLPHAERVVGLAHIKGLTPEDVLQGKTPQGITALWMHHRMQGSAMRQTQPTDHRYPLLPFSRLVWDSMQKDAGAEAVWTFPLLLRAREEDIDADRLSAAVERVVQHHPVFSMRITEDGTQHYEQGYRTPYLHTDVYTRDGYVCLSLSLNRILGDAASFVLFAQNIWRAYRDEALPPDDYLHYLQQYEETMQGRGYQEHAEWLQEQYGTPSCPLLPPQDSPEGLLPVDGTYTPYTVCPEYADRLEELHHQHGISINAFYCLATALAIMESNGTDSAGLTWAYLGRETRSEMSIFGSLHRDIPMKISKPIIGHCPPLLGEVRRGLEQGILHSEYPFTLLSPAGSPWHSAVNVLVQPSLAEAMEGCPARFEFVPVERSAQSYCMLDIDITPQPLTLTFNYSPRHYRKETIRRFAALIEKQAVSLLS